VVASIYSEWQNNGAPTAHSAWSPAASDQTADFSQSRSFKQAQSRTEQQQQLGDSNSVVNIGALVVHDRTIDDSESRSVSVSKNNWSDTSQTDQSTWTPAALEQTADFNQSRSYTQDQTRTCTYTAVAGTLPSN
jgi:hypothetical protein